MKVLVLSPHMDDEVLGCGGTIARHAKEGDQVHVVIVCNRAYAHSYQAKAIEAEKESAKRAKEILGYQELRFLDFPDERLEERFTDLLQALEPLAAEIRPEVVYTCHAGDLHQDHRTVAHAANIALRTVSAPYARRIFSFEIPSGTNQIFPGTVQPFLPNYFVDIEKYLKRKCDAMNAYERESRSFPHPRSPEMLRALAHARGSSCGRPAAEAFVLLRETR